LGHTGGTLDKLEAIPHFNVNLTLEEFKSVLRKTGCAIIGQTSDIAPADKKLYALRDVTSTVDNDSLICASIMSKKLAEGLDSLVLDVKVGSGAFMKTYQEAEKLATLMVETGKRMGKKVVALITDMNQPLGRYVGNALEVFECIEILKGRSSGELKLLCLELCGWMFFLGGKTASIEEGQRLAEQLIDSGAALQKFKDMVQLQGGDINIFNDVATVLPKATKKIEFLAHSPGIIRSVMCEQVGTACVVLGGGREKKEDIVDPAVGFVLHKKIGDAVSSGESIATVHYNSEEKLEQALALLKIAYHIDTTITVSTNLPDSPPRSLIRSVIQ